MDEVWSSDSSFFTLLKNSYQKGGAALLEEDIQTKLNEAISQLQPQQFSLALKHVLLYLKTSVENFGSVSYYFFPVSLKATLIVIYSPFH